MNGLRLPVALARLALVLLLPFVASCDSGPTDSHRGVELSAASARPLAMLSVAGLKPEVASATIRVGEMETALVYDPASGTHQFLVPLEEQGSVVVKIPQELTGGREAALRLRVLPPEYAGGSPDAAVALLSQAVDRLRGDAGASLRALAPLGEPDLAALAANLEESATRFQELLRAMTPEERRMMAVLYSSNRAAFDDVAGYLAAIGETPALAPGAYPRPASGEWPGHRESAAAAEDALPTTEMLAKRCIDANLRLEAVSDMLRAASYFDLALPAFLLLTTRNVKLAEGTALLTNAFVVGLHSAIKVQGMKPRFFAAEGLRLAPLPARVRENGGTGELRAYLTMISAEEASKQPGGVSYGKALSDFRTHYEGMAAVRKVTQAGALRQVLLDIGVDEVIELLDEAYRLLGDLYADGEPPRGGEIPVRMDGLEVVDVNHTNLWQFTTPAEGEVRSFRTVGAVRRDLGYEIIALSATAGRGESCTAKTAAANPQEGLNGFLVTGPPILRSARYALASIGSCTTSWGTGSLFRIHVDYFAANTLGPGSRVNVAWSFSPSGNAGTFSATNRDNTALGSQGEFAFDYCATYNDDQSTSIRFTATDPERLVSNPLMLTIPRPGGAPAAEPGRARTGGARPWSSAGGKLESDRLWFGEPPRR